MSWINYFERIGIRLYRLRHVLLVLATASATASVALLFVSAGAADRYLPATLILTAWFILCLAMASYFRAVEHQPAPGLLGRLRWIAVRALSYVLAVLFTLCTLLLLYLSLTAVRLALA